MITIEPDGNGKYIIDFNNEQATVLDCDNYIQDFFNLDLVSSIRNVIFEYKKTKTRELEEDLSVYSIDELKEIEVIARKKAKEMILTTYKNIDKSKCSFYNCPDCKGSGTVEDISQHNGDIRDIKCRRCLGYGRIPNEPEKLATMKDIKAFRAAKNV